MDFTLINPQPKYQPVKLIEPPPLGYVHLAAAVEPPGGRIPRPGSSPDKQALLARLKNLGHQLANLPQVVRATVYRGILIPPPGGYAKQATHPARYDVAVLVETTAPEVIGEVQASESYKLLLEAVQGGAEDLHVMAARCVKRVGDVDKTHQGLFLFNYFVAEDPQVARPTCEPTGPAPCRCCTGSPDRLVPPRRPDAVPVASRPSGRVAVAAGGARGVGAAASICVPAVVQICQARSSAAGDRPSVGPGQAAAAGSR